MTQDIKKLIGEVFLQVADGIESGVFQERKKVGLTLFGSEHGASNLVKGAEAAFRNDGRFDIVLIGPKVETKLEVIEVASEELMHTKMEELLDNGSIDACVTMHYNFPIGVSTVGRVVTPGQGREMLLATTTGTSSTNRVHAMIKNAIGGIITAKAIGIEKPTVGILNIDGARQVEKALEALNVNGYSIEFSESIRADGGAVMRGNDLLCPNVDVMVTDSLTGNLMMKMFSAYMTGGSYEALGYGYGPGVGADYNRLVLILSRASGVPVVANALIYAAQLAQGNLIKVAKQEFEQAKGAKLDEILAMMTKITNEQNKSAGLIKQPNKEVVTEEISGIDIMSLEEAVQALWREGIYAESGMGCTGPIVLVNENKLAAAKQSLEKTNFL